MKRKYVENEKQKERVRIHILLYLGSAVKYCDFFKLTSIKELSFSYLCVIYRDIWLKHLVSPLVMSNVLYTFGQIIGYTSV